MESCAPDIFRHSGFAGNFDATTRLIKFEAMIHAAYRAVFQPPLGQWRVAMAAPIFKRRNGAILSAIHDDRLVQESTRQQSVTADLVCPPSNIPSVLDPHDHASFAVGHQNPHK
jgi:hypothetical protein